jgi:hypothetical protein
MPTVASHPKSRRLIFMFVPNRVTGKLPIAARSQSQGMPTCIKQKLYLESPLNFTLLSANEPAGRGHFDSPADLSFRF